MSFITTVFHLFHYHSGLLPSLTGIMTIDLQLVSLFLFLPLPNHYPNPHSKQSDILKAPIRLHHCLFNNSLRLLGKTSKIFTKVYMPPCLTLASLSPSPTVSRWPLSVLCICQASLRFSIAPPTCSVCFLTSHWAT